jgi:hypothetical protein
MKRQRVNIGALLSNLVTRKGRAVGLLSLGWIAATALTTPSSVCAQHKYALVISNSIPSGDADKGIWVNIDTSVLSSSSCSQFVNHEAWYGVVPGFTYWVEVGAKTGANYIGGCITRMLFWADNRNGGGYHEHYENAVGWNTDAWYTFQILQTTSCAWDVWFSSLNLGTSTSNCPGTGRSAETGIEATNTASGQVVKGWTGGWSRLDSGGNWWGDWDGQGLYEDNPPLIQWMWSNTGSEEVLNHAF